MSDIVHVAHGVPLRNIPKGARTERETWAIVTTPVRMRTVGRREVKRVAQVRGRRHTDRMDLFALDGKLWRKLEEHWAGYHGRGVQYEWRPVGPEAFKDLLSDGNKHFHHFRETFGHTPLLPLTPGKNLHRGDVVDLAELRVVDDGATERARAALLRFMEEEVVVAGDDVFIRCLGPLFSYVHTFVEDRTRTDLVLTFSPREWAWLDGRGNHLARPDRLREMLDFMVDNRVVRRLEAEAMDRVQLHGGVGNLHLDEFHSPGGMLAGIDAHFHEGDEDLFVHANMLPRYLLPYTERLVRAMARGAVDADPAAVALHEAVRAWENPSRMGGIARDEVEPLLRQMLAGLRAVERWAHKSDGQVLERGARYIERIALPRLEAKATFEAEDTEAFSGLGPGCP